MEKPRIIEFQHVVNCGASLDIAESTNLPFKVERVFWIYGVEKGAVRGEHANKTSKEIVVAMKGKMDIELNGVDGSTYNFVLKRADQGVYIPPLFWGKITFSKDTILLALASDDYDEGDYIRNYDDFLRFKNQ